MAAPMTGVVVTVNLNLLACRQETIYQSSMKRALGFLALATLLGSSGSAIAQDAPQTAGGSAPPARVGFQMAVRTGYAVPMGDARGVPAGATGKDLAMSDAFSGQVPIFVEIGGKVIPAIFVGGYFGFGFGGAAGQFDTLCKQGGIDCASVGVRIGAEVQYHILPAEMANPWIGYGFGYESIALAMSGGGQTYTDSFSGFEFAHLMGGIDFRVSRIFGIGPFVDFSLGQYSKYHVEAPTIGTQEGDVQATKMHQWLAFGARGTFFP
jgi:hypothetical protein